MEISDFIDCTITCSWCDRTETKEWGYKNLFEQELKTEWWEVNEDECMVFCPKCKQPHL